jgi:multiple antibiotic resistance protein
MAFLTTMAAGIVALFPIVDPLAAAPMFIAMTAGDSDTNRRRQANHAVVYMAGILLTFFVAGLGLLEFFAISMEGLRIAGGLMIVYAARGMLQIEPRVDATEQAEAATKRDISMTPLAMPLLSGPGSIAVAVSLATQARTLTDRAAVAVAIIVVTLATWLILRGAMQVHSRVGPNAVAAMTRLMGFLTLCVGVQFVINGVRPLVILTLQAALPAR